MQLYECIQASNSLLPINLYIMVVVEGWRYRDHCSCLTHTLPQLKMMLPSFYLQKIFGQGVRTHPPISLLVLLSNILVFFMGPFSLGIAYLLLLCEGLFILPGALSPLMVGKLFGLS